MQKTLPPEPSAHDSASGDVMRLTILTAVYNDWASFTLLLAELDAVLFAQNIVARLIVVDDGSNETPELDGETLSSLQSIDSIEVLELMTNLGNQRAIAVGLSHVNQSLEDAAVVVMDADGEDRPQDLVSLIHQFKRERSAIVVASREKRQDGLIFRMFYAGYKALYRLLTGKYVNFGNYSIVPPGAVRRLAMMPDLWVHYPTAVLRSRVKVHAVPTARGSRYRGKSSMSFVPLVVHGLSGIALNSEATVVRLLVGLFALAALFVVGILTIVIVRLFAEVAIPGWASTMVGWMIVVVTQLFLGALVIVFVLVGIKTLPPFSPAVHYHSYIAAIRKLR